MEQSHDAVSLWILWLCRPISMMCSVVVGSVMSLAFETARKVCCSTVCHYLLLYIKVQSPLVHHTLVTLCFDTYITLSVLDTNLFCSWQIAVDTPPCLKNLMCFPVGI